MSTSLNHHALPGNYTPFPASASARCHFTSFKGRVEKWNLTFTVDWKQLSVHKFLERISELRLLPGISEQELFGSANDLFAGKALNRYCANRHRFDS